MVETSPNPEGFKIEVEVTKDHIKQYSTGMEDQHIEVFMNQLKPRLALVLNQEAESYVKFALQKFAEGKDGS